MENRDELNVERDLARKETQENIKESRKKIVKQYRNREGNFNNEISDLVEIKGTQFGVAIRLRPKYLGTYKIVTKLQH